MTGIGDSEKQEIITDFIKQFYVGTPFIPKEILKENLDRCVRIPMSDKVRSLNLSNCAALTIYEVLRQQDYPSLSKVEVQKGEEFLYDL